jgi:site-specific recombinase XerD
MTHIEFADHHFVLNSLTEARRDRVLRVLAEVEAWLGRPLHTATAEDLNRWMASKLAAGAAPSTVRFYLGMLRPYFRWAWKDKRLIDSDQWLLISEVRPPRGSNTPAPRPYKRPEIAQLWRDLDAAFPPFGDRADYYVARFKRGTTPYKRMRQHMRNAQTRAIVSLALFEGLRRKEIFALTVDELYPENAYLVVRGKRVDHREKIREVPYAEAARDAVREWLALRKLLRPRHRASWLALQQPKPGRPMTWSAFTELLERVGDGYELHRMRHTFATERLRAGMKIEKLQAVLGHSNIQQTLAYAKLVRDDLEAAMNASDERFMAAVGPQTRGEP